MKATIEPVTERKVTIEMTEGEARILKEYLGNISTSHIVKFVSDKSMTYDCYAVDTTLGELYESLDDALD